MLTLIQQLDGNLLINIQHLLIHDWLTPFMTYFTRLGTGGVLWIGISLMLLAFRQTRKMGFAGLLALLLMLVSVNVTLKPLIARTRPYEVFDQVQLLVRKQRDFSFPSGHTAASFAAAYSYFRMAHGKQVKYAVVALAAATLMGISRLYVGVHYPGDVVCGALIGMGCGWIACWAADKLTEQNILK